MQKECLESFSGKTKFSLEHEFFPSMIGYGLFGFKNESPVFDIGTPESYQNFLSSRELAVQTS